MGGFKKKVGAPRWGPSFLFFFLTLGDLADAMYVRVHKLPVDGTVRELERRERVTLSPLSLSHSTDTVERVSERVREERERERERDERWSGRGRNDTQEKE